MRIYPTKTQKLRFTCCSLLKRAKMYHKLINKIKIKSKNKKYIQTKQKQQHEHLTHFSSVF